MRRLPCCALLWEGHPARREPEGRAHQRRVALTANPRPCRRSETSPAERAIAAKSPLGIGVLGCRSFQCARMLYFHIHTASLSAGLRDDEGAAVGALCCSSAYSGWHSGHTIGAFDEGESIELLLILAICILTPLCWMFVSEADGSVAVQIMRGWSTVPDVLTR